MKGLTAGKIAVVALAALVLLNAVAGFVATTGGTSSSEINDAGNTSPRENSVEPQQILMGTTALAVSLLLVYFIGYSERGKAVRQRVDLESRVSLGVSIIKNF